MFIVKREHKIAILLIWGICLADVPGGYIIPPLFYILSEIAFWREYIYAIKRYRLSIFLIFFLLGIFILFVHSPHIRSIGEIAYFIKNEVVLKYIAILFPLVVLTKKTALKLLISVATCGLIVLTFWGILNLLTHHAIFVDWLTEGQIMNDIFEDAGSKFSDVDRFRVQAMFLNPFNYGFICLSFLLLFIYLKKERLVPQGLFLLMVFCCLFGVVFCGCRTIFICTAFGLCCYYAYTHKLISSIKYFSICGLIFLVAYFLIPFVHEAFNAKFLSLFDEGSDMGGSSIATRILQFTTVLYYIQDNIFLGRGYNFFNIDLNWKEGKSGVLDSDLFGLEGVYLSHLLERGIIGFLIYLLIMCILIKTFFYYHNSDRNTSAFCSSLIVSYLTFSIMTGELDVAFMSFILLGLGMKIHSFKANNEIELV